MINEKSKRVLLMINPTAGKLKAKTGIYDILSPFCAAGYLTTVYTTAARGEATEVVRRLGGDYDMVVCCGGDGTLNEVIDGLVSAGHKPLLGYVPAGSTNDFAATLGLSSDVSVAARAILAGKPRLLDVGCFDETRYFSYIASFGAFTSSSYTAPQTTKNAIGHLAYVLEGIKDLPSIQPITLTAETDDGVKYEGNFIFGAVSNSTSIGGMVKLDASLVDLSDGLFEVVLIRMPKNLGELNRILYAITAKDYGEAGGLLEITRARSIRFTMPSTLAWSLDGEFAESSTTATIRAMRGAVRLVV